MGISSSSLFWYRCCQTEVLTLRITALGTAGKFISDKCTPAAFIDKQCSLAVVCHHTVTHPSGCPGSESSYCGLSKMLWVIKGKMFDVVILGIFMLLWYWLLGCKGLAFVVQFYNVTKSVSKSLFIKTWKFTDIIRSYVTLSVPHCLPFGLKSLLGAFVSLLQGRTK